MKKLFFSVLIISCLLILSCAKGKNSNETPDCQLNNYGIIKVTFGATNIRHGIITAPFGSPNDVRDKIIAAGKPGDTLRLASGKYNISIASLNSSNAAIDSKNFQITISSCQEIELSVPF